MIVLIGFMGAGKTTVGRLLAAALDVPFLDADEVIEAEAGRPVARLFADEGEAAFRAREHTAVTGLLAGPSGVLALGGGAAEHPGTRAALAGATVVWLRVGLDEALGRTGPDPRRPLLARPDLPEVYARREPTFAALATHVVPTDGLAPGAVVERVRALLGM